MGVRALNDGDSDPGLVWGEFRLLRSLGEGACGMRWLVAANDATTLCAHTLSSIRDGSQPIEGLVEEVAGRLATVTQVHLPRVLCGRTDPRLGPAIVAEHVGPQSGLVTLDDVCVASRGRLPPAEVENAADHLLQAMDAAHSVRLYNGPLDARQILLDRQGRLRIEMFGVRRMLTLGLQKSIEVNESEIRDEVRSVVHILFRALTGLSAERFDVSAAQAVSSLDPALDEWFDRGLRSGFASAEQARAALPQFSQLVAQPPGLWRTALDAVSSRLPLRRK